MRVQVDKPRRDDQAGGVEHLGGGGAAVRVVPPRVGQRRPDRHDFAFEKPHVARLHVERVRRI